MTSEENVSILFVCTFCLYVFFYVRTLVVCVVLCISVCLCFVAVLCDHTSCQRPHIQLSQLKIPIFKYLISFMQFVCVFVCPWLCLFACFCLSVTVFVCVFLFVRDCVCLCLSMTVFACAFLFVRDCVCLRVFVCPWLCLFASVFLSSPFKSTTFSVKERHIRYIYSHILAFGCVRKCLLLEKVLF